MKNIFASNNLFFVKKFVSVIAVIFVICSPLQASAVAYNINTNPPGDCVLSNAANSSTAYTCTNLTLAAGDSLDASEGTTIRINGVFNSAGNNIIKATNNSNSTAIINIKAVGAISIGAGSVMNAILFSETDIILGENVTLAAGSLESNTGLIEIGNRGTIRGSIQSNRTQAAGALQLTVLLGCNMNMTGNIKSIDGWVNFGYAHDKTTKCINEGSSDSNRPNKLTGTITVDNNVINIGDYAKVTSAEKATLKTINGVINVGDHSNIWGTINTKIGAINVGASSRVDGSLQTGSGAITVGNSSTVTGNIETGIGAITIGNDCLVGGNINNKDTSSAGAVTVGTGTVVKGFVSSNVGAISIGKGSQTGGVSSNTGAVTMCGHAKGSVCTGTAGAITICAGSKVEGNVTAHDGALTVEKDATVTGKLKIVGEGDISAASANVIGQDIDSPCRFQGPVVIIKSRQWRQIFMR